MGCKGCKGLIVPALALLCAMPVVSAQERQEQTDSLVRLMQGKSLQLIEDNGIKYRKAVDATFLHNGTYLICDTALWNVDAKVINSWGHVKLIQDETVLTSDRLDYDIDGNLARFRGSVVQLQNKENSTLRATNLDYNTKDSTAIFRDGAAMKDKDGQVIESREGIYDSRSKIFDFDHDVNMYTDSVFVRTSHMVYDSGRNTAVFTDYIDFWNEGNMLSAGGGWYNRETETFFFRTGVHGLSERQESWSDTLYVYRNIKDVEMIGNAQIQDTSRHVTALAEHMYYCDSLSTVTMKNQAAVALSTREKNKVDTLYAGADTIVYRGIRKCDVLESVSADAATRLKNITFDAVAEFRRKAAEAAAKAKEEAAAKAMEEDPNAGPKAKPAKEEAASGPGQPESAVGAPKGEGGTSDIPPSGASGADDSTSPAGADSLSAGADSLSAAADSVIVLPDTTRIGFLTAVGRVRIFRKDIQVRCDSLVYCDLDSIARFYTDPIVWNDGNRQYTSDSLYVLVRNGGMDRASLMGNAFIITQEDSLRFDQIKSAEVVAYFDSTSALKRFDALGGASAMFYLKENESLATVNKVESKMLSAVMSKGQLDRVYYYESPKNDAYPVAQMRDQDHRMKGFDWRSDQKPRGPGDITGLKVKVTERAYYEGRPKAVFVQTDRFFPGYMESVYAGIEAARLRKNNPAPSDTLHLPDSLLTARADSLLALPDSLLAVTDSLRHRTDSLRADSDSLPAVTDSLRHSRDSLGAASDSLRAAASDSLRAAASDSLLMIPPTKKELREEARKLAIARRDARWAEQDAKEAAKAAAKEQKKLEKKRARTRRLLILQAEQDAKDNARREKYRRHYEKKKAREDARAAARALKDRDKNIDTDEQEPEPAGERAPQALSGGDVQTFDGARREAR